MIHVRGERVPVKSGYGGGAGPRPVMTALSALYMRTYSYTYPISLSVVWWGCLLQRSTATTAKSSKQSHVFCYLPPALLVVLNTTKPTLLVPCRSGLRMRASISGLLEPYIARQAVVVAYSIGQRQVLPSRVSSTPRERGYDMPQYGTTSR